jgi:hypothetical protein
MIFVLLSIRSGITLLLLWPCGYRRDKDDGGECCVIVHYMTEINSFQKISRGIMAVFAVSTVQL